jgi:hypothetical protein
MAYRQGTPAHKRGVFRFENRPFSDRAANWVAVLPVATNVPPSSSTTQALVSITQTWKYEQSGTDLGTAWKERTYSDASWPSGSWAKEAAE